jgi:hypothetical protein
MHNVETTQQCGKMVVTLKLKKTTITIFLTLKYSYSSMACAIVRGNEIFSFPFVPAANTAADRLVLLPLLSSKVQLGEHIQKVLL